MYKIVLIFLFFLNIPVFSQNLQDVTYAFPLDIDINQVFELKWKSRINGLILTSLVIADDMIFFGNTHSGKVKGSFPSFNAVDINTGKQKWKFKADNPYGMTSAAIADGIVCFVLGSKLYGVNVDTGQEKWKIETGSGSIQAASPVILDKTIYLGRGSRGIQGFLYAVNLYTGEINWRFDTRSEIFTTPVIHAGVVYFGCWDGKVYGLDIDTGKMKWHFEIKGVVSTLSVTDKGMLYFGGTGGYFYAVDIVESREIWKFRTDDINLVSITTDETIYFGGRFGGEREAGYLYAVDIESGSKKWLFSPYRFMEITSPAIKNGNIYLGYFQHFYILDAQTGQVKWKINQWITTSPVIADEVIYFQSGDGYIYAMDM